MGEYYCYDTNLRICLFMLYRRNNSMVRRLYTLRTRSFVLFRTCKKLYAFAAGGAFWKVAPYITDQPIVSNRAKHADKN
jgi:hypothetical protein